MRRCVPVTPEQEKPGSDTTPTPLGGSKASVLSDCVHWTIRVCKAFVWHKHYNGVNMESAIWCGLEINSVQYQNDPKLYFSSTESTLRECSVRQPWRRGWSCFLSDNKSVKVPFSLDSVIRHQCDLRNYPQCNTLYPQCSWFSSETPSVLSHRTAILPDKSLFFF